MEWAPRVQSKENFRSRPTGVRILPLQVTVTKGPDQKWNTIRVSSSIEQSSTAFAGRNKAVQLHLNSDLNFCHTPSSGTLTLDGLTGKIISVSYAA